MDSTWSERAEQWRSFAEWENRRLRAMPDDFVAALAWMSEAWELARHHDPSWDSLELTPERDERRARFRLALAGLRPMA